MSKSGGVEYDVVDALTGRMLKLEKDKDRSEQIELDGFFRAPVSGFHQLTFRFKGRLEVDVNNKRVLESTPSDEEEEAIVPLSLGAGWHRIHLTYEPLKRPYLRAVLSGEHVATLLDKTILRH